MRTTAAFLTASFLTLGACGSEEPEVLTNAQQVHEAYANNLEQAASAREGEGGELERRARIHQQRAETLAERPGEIEVQPVIVDTESKGVEGTAWDVEGKSAE